MCSSDLWITRRRRAVRPLPRVRIRAAAMISAGVLATALTGCGALQRLGGIAARPAGATATGKVGSQVTSTEPLVPSPRLVVGRVVALDWELRQAIVELGPEAPAEAVAPDAELTTRDAGLRETGKLRVSRQLRGRILGTFLVSGSPAVDNEVVWLAP